MSHRTDATDRGRSTFMFYGAINAWKLSTNLLLMGTDIVCPDCGHIFLGFCGATKICGNGYHRLQMQSVRISQCDKHTGSHEGTDIVHADCGHVARQKPVANSYELAREPSSQITRFMHAIPVGRCLMFDRNQGCAMFLNF